MTKLKNITTIFIFVFSLNLAALAFNNEFDGRQLSLQTGIPPQSVLKNTVFVRTYRRNLFWKAPDQNDYWNWTPAVEFSFMGPMPRGNQLSVEFTMPDGSPWFSEDLHTDVIGEGQLGSTASLSTGTLDKRAIITTGTFGFKIILTNGLENTRKELYKGKFTVNKVYRGNGLPQFKNQNEFYVEQDWVMPIGYLGFNTQVDPKGPPLWASMWFRGSNNATELQAFLFYNGKQIASTTNSDTGSANSMKSLLTSGNDADPRWELWAFSFSKVRSNPSENIAGDSHILSKNPGAYEIKVLRDGELVRVAGFTVGADGKIVDNGLAGNNGIYYFMILPVKIMGTKDGKWNNLAWKTDAYYGNVLNGFAAP